jgi:enoyl-CoA hydratase/carnithine racemase
MTQYACVELAVAEGIGRLTLNRPPLNALTPAMMAEVAAAATQLDRDEAVNVILLEAVGNAFSAGGDMAFLAELNRKPPFDIKSTVYASFAAGVKAVKLAHKPVVAAVNGAAVGAGCELALAADFRVGSTRAMFQQSWINIGCISPLGGLFLLPRLVGLAKANEMMLLGSKVQAEEAQRIGLLNELVAPAELPGAAMALARRLADGPPLALRAMKESLRRALETTLAGEWEHNVYVQSMLLASEDFGEGVAALREGRRPRYQGR